MTTTISQSESTLASAIRIDGRRFYNIVGEICEISERNYTRVEYYGQCFEAISRYFGAMVGILNLRQGARTLERTYSVNNAFTQKWVDAIDSLVLQSQTDETALSQVYRNHEGSVVACALAAPIQSASGKTLGAVAFVADRSHAESIESQLLQVSQLLELVVENSPASQSAATQNQSVGDKQTLQSVVRAGDYHSITQLSFAIVNSLCNKFSCEQVGIGLVRNRDVRLLAVSGLSEIPKNTPGMMAIQQAMAVCSDRNDVTVVQKEGQLVGQFDSSSCKIHQFWHQLAGESCVATIPLRIDGECIAVISLRRKAKRALMPEDLHRIRLLAESFAPALPLVDRASRSIVRHLSESCLTTVGAIYSWQKIGPKIVAAAVGLLLLWAVFGKIEHRVFAPCKIVPEQIYTVSAPLESLIDEVYVLPGQIVKAGDVLMQLDTKDLMIEQMSIRTAVTSTQIEVNALLSRREHQAAFLLQADIDVLKTDLELVDEQIHRSRIVAAQNGVVMPTEIHRRVGQFVALGDPMLEIAKQENWHLEINVSENDAPYLAQSQLAEFQSNARPDQQLRCQVSKISPSSQVLRNKNVVITEAMLLDHQEWMKLGMEGHIRIATGKQSVWWVYLHPVLDYVRLKLWL